MTIADAQTAWPAARIEQRKLSDLTPYARNARTHSPAQVEQIAASMKEFGWTMPLLVDEAGGILAGHGRVMAAAKLGLDEAPVMVATGWTDEQKRAYVLADNQLALNANWDMELLAGELSDLVNLNFDVDLIGFDPDFVTGLLGSGAGKTEPDDVPPVPARAVTLPGDLWQLGDHRVLCGDSTDPDNIERLLAGAVPTLMVTDPPYGVEYDPSWRRELNGGKAATGKVLNDDRANWEAAWRLFPGNVAYVWHGGLHEVEVVASLEAVGFPPRSQIIWVKTRAPISRGNYHWQHEPAIYAERSDGDDAGEAWLVDHEAAAYVVRAGKAAGWRGGRKQTTVWFIEHVKSETGHGTQKPVECMRRPILNNSKPGGDVYDPFLGSGTTMIAAEMEGRHCYGLELHPPYCDVIIKRWQDFTGKEAKLEDGRTFEDVADERYDFRKDGFGCYNDWMEFKRKELTDGTKEAGRKADSSQKAARQGTAGA